MRRPGAALKGSSDGDERGVSPVVGSILLVAVTVILAGFLASLTIGLSEDVTRDDPLVAFEIDQDDGTVVLRHANGETLDGENTYLVSESNGSLGNFAGTDGSACDATISTVEPGTTCNISNVSSGTVSVVWRSAGRSAILFDGRVVDFESSSTQSKETSAGAIEAVATEGVDTQSSEVELALNNSESDSVTVVDFAVDATAVSSDVYIDDGNNPEFETSGATDDGEANDGDRKDDSFLADGTVYRLDDYGGEPVKMAASDDEVTLTLRAFGPDDEWIEDSEDLEIVDDESDADVVVALGLEDGSTAEIYLRAA